MRSLEFLILIVGFSVITMAQRPNIDPAHLRHYYQQVQQQQQTAGAGDATPIYEHNSEQSQQYANSGQQLRIKDTVQEQIRAQQQQQQKQQHQSGYVAPAVREYVQNSNQPHQVHYQTESQQSIYRSTQPASLPRTQPLHQYKTQPSPKSKAQLQQEEEEYDDQNASYQFGFDVKDDEFTNYQNRKEVRDGSVIKGSYSVVDSDGFIRTVKYTADPKEGFKAEVIREPTDIVVKIPTPAPQQILRNGPKSSDYAPKPQYKQQQQYQQYQQ